MNFNSTRTSRLLSTSIIKVQSLSLLLHSTLFALACIKHAHAHGRVNKGATHIKVPKQPCQLTFRVINTDYPADHLTMDYTQSSEKALTLFFFNWQSGSICLHNITILTFTKYLIQFYTRNTSFGGLTTECLWRTVRGLLMRFIKLL